MLVGLNDLRLYSLSALGEQVYPGLVGHIVPTNCFRNNFDISVASRYVGQEISKWVERSEYNEVESLLGTLLNIPEARDFGGWIWEPLLLKKMKNETANIKIVGSTLPAVAANVSILFQSRASNIRCIEFSNLDDFLAKAKQHLDAGDTGISLFAKAQSDYFPAFDAILMTRRGDHLSIAALQLTVAEERHSVLQSMLIEFVKLFKSIRQEATPQLSFLHPEQSLSCFGFVTLQAMQFDETTYETVGANSAHPQTGTGARKSSRSRRSPEKFGTWVQSNPGEGRKQSYDRNYWDENVRDLPQYVGLVQMETSGTDTAATERDKITQELKNALSTGRLEERDKSICDVTGRVQFKSCTL